MIRSNSNAITHTYLSNTCELGKSTLIIMFDNDFLDEAKIIKIKSQ